MYGMSDSLRFLLPLEDFPHRFSQAKKHVVPEVVHITFLYDELPGTPCLPYEERKWTCPSRSISLPSTTH